MTFHCAYCVFPRKNASEQEGVDEDDAIGWWFFYSRWLLFALNINFFWIEKKLRMMRACANLFSFYIVDVKAYTGSIKKLRDVLQSTLKAFDFHFRCWWKMFLVIFIFSAGCEMKLFICFKDAKVSLGSGKICDVMHLGLLFSPPTLLLNENLLFSMHSHSAQSNITLSMNLCVKYNLLRKTKRKVLNG